MDFPDPRKIPLLTSLTPGVSPAATIMEPIILWKKRGPPSEGNDITAVVSYVTDNLARVFLGIIDTQQGVTESAADMQERVNTLYSNVKEVCD